MAGGSLFQVGQDVEFWRVLVHLSILALSLVLVEKALHRMEHKFPRSDKYQHMLKKVYRELMVLGLISLGLKIFKETSRIDSSSKTILAFQVADLTVFFLALALILQTTAVFQLLRNQNRRAERAELLTTHDLIDMMEEVEGPSPSIIETLFSCGRAAKKKIYIKKLIELRLLRHLFLRRFGFPQLFPFSNFLNRAQANQISHMIEVNPLMWLVLLAVAWGICGLLDLFETIDTKMPEREELVEAFMIVAWVLLLLHVIVFLYFRSCVNHLLRKAGFAQNKAFLMANLNVIAKDEAKAWFNEEADKALEIMSFIQEQHEEIELERIQRHRKFHKTEGRIGAFFRQVNGFMSRDSKSKERESMNGVVPGSPTINIQYFSYHAWHVSVILLLILNGFFITLFLQCAMYDLDEIYEDFGALPTALVPLPLVLNALYFQRHIFYDFVIVSSTLRINSHTLSDVIENFSEIVRLRSEFATSLLHQMTQQELSISDLKEELKTYDPTASGFIDIDDLRSVLAKFGFRLTRFRFNSVVKLLFELEGTAVTYGQVLRLVAMAENESENDIAILSEHPSHPLLRPSVMMCENAAQASALSQADYSLYASARSLQPNVGGVECNFDESVGDSFVMPLISEQDAVNHNAGAQQPVVVRPSFSSHALHSMFNLQSLPGDRKRCEL
ncbi:hypothetical protein KXD40_000939 [Peronospora effusa]|nr:hypothetical protein KXD40_000939 [Peronospora effusa]CAI5724467.1 unnamed protein product [Peronospora effusa]